MEGYHYITYNLFNQFTIMEYLVLQSFTDQDLGTGVNKRKKKREREQYLLGYVENQ